MMMNVLSYTMVGLVGGFVGWRLKISGGVLLGSMISIILFKVFFQKDIEIPTSFNFLTQVMVGILIGSTFKPEVLLELKNMVWSILLSTFVLILTGFLVAFIITRINHLDFPTAYLSTSPGGMTALTGLALDSVSNPAMVVAFHFFRLSFINLTTPFIFALLAWLMRSS